MLVRGIAGAVVGALAGLGFLLTWDAVGATCLPYDARCGLLSASFVLYLVLWAVAAGVMLLGAFRVLDRPPYWAASGSGCVLWVATGVVGVGVLGVNASAVVVPAVCFALTAALTTPEPSSSAHGSSVAAPE